MPRRRNQLAPFREGETARKSPQSFYRMCFSSSAPRADSRERASPYIGKHTLTLLNINHQSLRLQTIDWADDRELSLTLRPLPKQATVLPFFTVSWRVHKGSLLMKKHL